MLSGQEHCRICQGLAQLSGEHPSYCRDSTKERVFISWMFNRYFLWDFPEASWEKLQEVISLVTWIDHTTLLVMVRWLLGLEHLPYWYLNCLDHQLCHLLILVSERYHYNLPSHFQWLKHDLVCACVSGECFGKLIHHGHCSL